MLANLLLVHNLNQEIIWDAIKKIRFKVSLEKICDSAKSFYIPSDKMSNVREVEKQLQVNSSDLINENMTRSQMKIAAEMFLYLNTCPELLRPWFSLYTDLFQKQSPNEIILTLNRILKFYKVTPHNSSLTSITLKLFKRVSTLFTLKYQQIKIITQGSQNSTLEENNYGSFKGVLVF